MTEPSKLDELTDEFYEGIVTQGTEGTGITLGEFKQQLSKLLAEIIGEDNDVFPTENGGESIFDPNYRGNKLRQEQRQRAKERGFLI